MSRLRSLGLLTTGRADYFLVRPLARACEQAGLKVVVYVCGGHFGGLRGDTAGLVLSDFGADARIVANNLEGDRRDALAKSAGLLTVSLAQALGHEPPEAMLVLGDRFETLAASYTAVQMGLALVHVHGGEVSAGALDDSLRHAITKLAHIHLTAAEPFAERVRQLGEEDWRVHVIGAPGLDAFVGRPPADRAELEAAIDAPLGPSTALCTIHSETVGDFDGGAAVAQVAQALAGSGLDIVVTAPNQDEGHQAILQGIERWAAADPKVRFRPWLGDRYPDVLRHVGVVIGNSSSGLIETAAVPVPTVNLGRRQEGRLRPGNVIDAPFEAAAIRGAIEHARSEAFRADLERFENPYGDGRACARAADILSRAVIDDRLMRKRFVDRP
ncbi:UDP-N-acetylglucosamine 2-epimerase [Phenylobacterium terrae]|uniref:UDP-N-acetylglucosamine 2-epimerase n=1 Tax=Phenylobacterium terrae TaxID=2665495 RepID=A0ABW4N3A7_9CAUL